MNRSFRDLRAESQRQRREVSNGVSLLLVCVLCVSVVSFTGACGRKPAASSFHDVRMPQRIISLSPSITDILYEIGAFNRVVAVTRYCSYPPEALLKPRVGGWLDFSLESVLALHPDIVILTEVQSPLVRAQLESIGVPAAEVPSQSLDDAIRAIVEVGRIVGNEREAGEVARRVRLELEGVRLRASVLPRPRVVCIAGRTPGTLRELYIATHGSFLAELIDIAGGAPESPRAGSAFVEISKEALVALDPDVILDLTANGTSGEKCDQVWGELVVVRAVRMGRVYAIDDPLVLHASQHVSMTARRFAELLHPEVFADGKSTERPR